MNDSCLDEPHYIAVSLPDNAQSGYHKITIGAWLFIGIGVTFIWF